MNENRMCPDCMQWHSALVCPFCELKKFAPPEHAVAADIVQTSSLSSPNQQVDYKTVSWDDWQLLFPQLWPNWAAGKLLDPSQESDPVLRRNQLGGVAQQLNNVVNTCSALPDTMRQNWKIFAHSFVPWYGKDPSFWDPSLDDEQAKLIQNQLRDWQTQISQYCNINMPMLPTSSSTLSQIAEETLATVGKYFDTMKFVIGAGVVLALVTVAILGVDGTRKIVAKVVG